MLQQNKSVWEKYDPKSFTAKYNLAICVYYEVYPSIEEAIVREKQLKKWNRSKKDYLVDSKNKEWKDLYQEYLHGNNYFFLIQRSLRFAALQSRGRISVVVFSTELEKSFKGGLIVLFKGLSVSLRFSREDDFCMLRLI